MLSGPMRLVSKSSFQYSKYDNGGQAGNASRKGNLFRRFGQTQNEILARRVNLRRVRPAIFEPGTFETNIHHARDNDVRRSQGPAHLPRSTGPLCGSLVPQRFRPISRSHVE